MSQIYFCFIEVTLYMFRKVFPSIIRSSKLYSTYCNRYWPNRYCCLLASGYEMFHLVLLSKQSAVSVWHMPVAVCTVLNSWWWTERPPETC